MTTDITYFTKTHFYDTIILNDRRNIVQDVSFYHLLKFYIKNWLIITIILSISFVLGIVYNDFIQVPLYKSDATLLLVRSNTVNPDTSLINNYIELFKSRRVLEPVIEKQNINMRYDDFVKNVEVISEKNTDVIKISVATDGAEKSKEFVKKAVVSFKENSKDLYSADNIQVVDDASFNDKPYNVHKELVLIISSLTGLLIALFSLFLVYDYKQNKGSKNNSNNNSSEDEEKSASIKKDTEKTSSPKTEEPTKTENVIHDHQGMDYVNRAAWARAVYSRERQIRR